MFGISLDELLVIVLVAIIFVRPTDFPAILKGYKSTIKSAVKYKRAIEQYFADLHNKVISMDPDKSEKDLEASDQSSFIFDDDGKVHRAYDISEFKKSRKK
jgi:Sec-independent protein translocase protein TatA